MKQRKYQYKNIFFWKQYKRWLKQFLDFWCYLVLKKTFYNSKYPVDINDVDIKKILIPNKVLNDKKGFEYFTGYKDDEMSLYSTSKNQ